MTGESAKKFSTVAEIVPRNDLQANTWNVDPNETNFFNVSFFDESSFCSGLVMTEHNGLY